MRGGEALKLSPPRCRREPVTETTRPAPEFLALQRAVAGRFSLVRELGRGGMGQVFLARDLALDRLVAIKLLPPALGAEPEARERFVREARMAARLSHPHIVPIHLVERQGELVFFVMGYVEGETLGERVRRAGALPAPEAMRVIQEVAWALAHAHANQVVHHDVKPDNVLLDATTGRAMVVDFGIARSLEGDTPTAGTVRGTAQYLSPEVAQGAPGDSRSDLYSLGVTAWVAAAGRLPFEARSAAGQVLAHVQTVAPALGDAARVPARFAQAVDRCLQKDPAARWSSADAFAAEIDAARSRGPSAPSVLRAFVREWEGTSGEIGTAATATAVALTTSGALPLWDYLTTGKVGFTGSALSWIFLVIAVITGGLAKARVLQLAARAREILRAGHSHARVAAVQRMEEASRAELSSPAESPALRARDGWWSLGGLAAGWMGALWMAHTDTNGIVIAVGAAGSVLLPTLALRTLHGLLVGRAADSLAGRLLRGKAGGWLFRFAGLGLGPVANAAALEGPEPTALALGEAARDLLAQLPPELRQALPADLGGIIDALEERALRRATEREAGPDRAELVDALGALENIRLDLLRLSVRDLSPGEFTRELARARDLGQAVDRRLAAEESVERLLAPRPDVTS